ncbi:alcohol dehydrogenase catalytic domain-containing protein [Microcoleus sp. FACHB-SPT15]|uniref:alcohol dehydrogenase catalytic domain-containing protein n=1 Tax=Microcoleus sp. FACHB-SPT15 TaxID=2692830 RepID=UPI001784DDA3|nr:alcohol dehydrogenase catalytic domain-containing protein [Microcoleus sp. FACHB-SPT15]MBD1804110.1 alcohol dehydrogenase catalytic domain-containing protein [Microcoleus sp. FACHB-SPT15]
MKAAVVPALNGQWEVKEVPTPEPGANQVLLKIHASGLCYTDVHITKGEIPTEFPRILGHEPVGEIVAIGEGVTSRQVGDRVGVPWVQASCGRCEWCLRGKRMFCAQQIGTGVQTQGSHAEYMLAYADTTMLLPDNVSYEQAAPIFCAGYTVWSGLRFADPKPHERIAILGVGGLGYLGVQYSKAAGFETIAITHSKDKEKLVRDLGADEVVADGEGLKAIGGADVILATGNSYKAASAALGGLRPDGRMVLMGVSDEPLQVTSEAIMNRTRIIGSTQNGSEYLYEALDYVAKGKVKVIAETYSLNDISRAYERVLKGEARFRAVIAM